MRTGTPALNLAMILLDRDVSWMNHKDTSIPTLSLSMSVHNGWRQSSKDVSHNLSTCADVWVDEKRTSEANANARARCFMVSILSLFESANRSARALSVA